MAIRTRLKKNGSRSYQVKIRDTDGNWITKTFQKKREAEQFECDLRQKIYQGTRVTQSRSELTVNEFFCKWMKDVRFSISSGWKNTQVQLYKDYISEQIGEKNVRSVKGADISKVLGKMRSKGKSEQTQLHVYNLLSKMFNDAIELFELINKNPASKILKPKIPEKEAKFLTYEEVLKLLAHSRKRENGIFVWLGILAGLRISEIQPLKWSDIDFSRSLLRINKSYSKGSKKINAHTKTGKVYEVALSKDFLDFAKDELKKKNIKSLDSYIFKSQKSELGFYDYTYFKKLIKTFCKESGVKEVTPHGLRHSASVLLLENGATKDDIQFLLRHSNPSTTKRYLHDKEFRRARQTELLSSVTICDHSEKKDIEELNLSSSTS